MQFAGYQPIELREPLLSFRLYYIKCFTRLIPDYFDFADEILAFGCVELFVFVEVFAELEVRRESF